PAASSARTKARPSIPLAPTRTTSAMERQLVARDVGEAPMAKVARGEDLVAARPVDAERGVVPRDAELELGPVVLRALVGEEGRRARDVEAVREARREVELVVVLRREPGVDVLPEGRGADAYVDAYVEDLALEHLHELALAVRVLQMQAP